MAKIKCKDTKPERFIRKLLYANGYRYRLNVTTLPGKPDIYLSKYKTTIFVNGCFWHRHEGCKYSYMPKSNIDFWNEKLTGNQERDKWKYAELIAQRIRVIVIWECTVENAIKSKEVRSKLLSDIEGLLTRDIKAYEL